MHHFSCSKGEFQISQHDLEGFLSFLYLLLFMLFFPTCMYESHVLTSCIQRSEGMLDSPGTGAASVLNRLSSPRPLSICALTALASPLLCQGCPCSSLAQEPFTLCAIFSVRLCSFVVVSIYTPHLCCSFHTDSYSFFSVQQITHYFFPFCLYNLSKFI